MAGTSDDRSGCGCVFGGLRVIAGLVMLVGSILKLTAPSNPPPHFDRPPRSAQMEPLPKPMPAFPRLPDRPARKAPPLRLPGGEEP